MAELNKTLKDIAGLIEQQVKGQTLDHRSRCQPLRPVSTDHGASRFGRPVLYLARPNRPDQGSAVSESRVPVIAGSQSL